MIPNTNDGSSRPPRLRVDLNLGTLWDLPSWSRGPRGDDDARLAAIRAAGYEGVQGGDPRRCRAHDLGCTSSGRVDRAADAGPLIRRTQDDGHQALTLHVGSGDEDDAAIDALIDAILVSASDARFPVFVETHRATVTQDTWRTRQLVRRRPALRFNGDFSHWYTGLEMRYGDWEARLAAIAPVLERVRFCHGRVGNGSHLQVRWDDPSMTRAIADFRELWTRAMVGFLRDARPGDVFIFAPELLPAQIDYARLIPGPDGALREESDRWLDALAMDEAARASFAEAQRRIAAASSATG